MAIVLQPTSNKQFTEEPISDYDIQRLFETTIWAPSPFNSQPWEFIFIRKKEFIREILQTDELPPNLLVVLNDLTRQDPGPNALKLGFMAIGTVLANLMATAAYSQIGVYHIPEGEKDTDRIIKYLGIPSHLKICCLLAVGYLDDKTKGDVSGKVDVANPYPLIRQRKSYRKKFLNKDVSKENCLFLNESASSSFLFKSPNKIELVFLEDKSKIKQIAKLIDEMSYRQHMDQGYSKKMNAWMRYSVDEKIQTGDGVFLILGHRMLGKMLKAFVRISENVKILYPLKVLTVKKISKDLFGDLVASSPLISIVLLKMAGNDTEPTEHDYINAGIAMQSMLLCATRFDIGAQFLSLLVETVESKTSISKILNISDGTKIIDLFRMGYIDRKSKSKIISVSSNIRRPVEKIVHFEKY